MQDLKKALPNISRPDNSLEFELHANTSFLKMHSAAPSGSWCGGQRQLSAANGSLVLGSR